MNSGSFSPASLPMAAPDFFELASNFVTWFLRRSPWLKRHREDLRQQAAVGALVAARRYKANARVAFSTYAWYWMHSGVDKYLRRTIGHPKVKADAIELFTGRPAEVDADGHVRFSPESARVTPVDAARKLDGHALIKSLRAALLRARSRTTGRRGVFSAGRAEDHPENDVDFFIAVMQGESIGSAGKRYGMSRQRAWLLYNRMRPVFESWKATVE